MVNVKDIDWQAFKHDLQLAKSNEHIWAIGSDGDGAEMHLSNENRIEDEIIAIENNDYEIVLSHYDESVFEEYIINS